MGGITGSGGAAGASSGSGGSGGKGGTIASGGMPGIGGAAGVAGGSGAMGTGGAAGPAGEAGMTGTGGNLGTGGAAGLADADAGFGGTAGADGGGVDGAATCSPGGAVAFPASGADVYLPGVDATQSSGFTWEFWFNAAQLPSTSSVNIRAGATMLISADQPHGCEDVYVGFGTEFTPANALAFNVDGSGLCPTRDTSAINYAPPGGFETQHWYFVAASHDYAGQVTDLYLDGKLVASKTSSVQPRTFVAPVTVGRWTDRAGTNYNQFYGAIDEIRIYDRVLTAAEISADYGSGSPGRYGASSDTGLVAGYHFDDGSGSTARTFAPTGSDGVLEGAADWTTGLVCAPSERK